MITTDVSRYLSAALKSKAPVVAIPVEGHAPVCIKRSRLQAWAKGVEVLSVEVRAHPDEYYFEEITVRGQYEYVPNRLHVWEGPKDVKAVRVPGNRTLVITGQVRSKGLLYASYPSRPIKTTARFFPISRQDAIKELSKWAEKERLKIEKQRLLGALGKETKKALKRAKFEEDSDNMVTVCVAGKLETDPKTEHKGVLVDIPEFPTLRFAVVRFDNANYDEHKFSVTEITSGKSAGSGDTAEEAIITARKNALKISAKRREEIREEIAA